MGFYENPAFSSERTKVFDILKNHSITNENLLDVLTLPL